MLRCFDLFHKTWSLTDFPYLVTYSGNDRGLSFQQQIDRYGGFHSHGGAPIAGWFMMENPTKMGDDLGVPQFLDTFI